MKKTVISRGLLGFPLGIAIGYVITIMISVAWGSEDYTPCVPELVDLMGNEIRAVLLQTALCGLIGTGFAASSVIWEIDQWSLVKATGIYFLITSVIMMPVAYFTYWMEHSIVGFLSYFGVFTLIFIIIWIILFIMGKHNVSRMNTELSKMKDE